MLFMGGIFVRRFKPNSPLYVYGWRRIKQCIYDVIQLFKIAFASELWHCYFTIAADQGNFISLVCQVLYVTVFPCSDDFCYCHCKNKHGPPWSLLTTYRLSMSSWLCEVCWWFTVYKTMVNVHRWTHRLCRWVRWGSRCLQKLDYITFCHIYDIILTQNLNMLEMYQRSRK